MRIYRLNAIVSVYLYLKRFIFIKCICNALRDVLVCVCVSVCEYIMCVCGFVRVSLNAWQPPSYAPLLLLSTRIHPRSIHRVEHDHAPLLTLLCFHLRRSLWADWRQTLVDVHPFDWIHPHAASLPPYLHRWSPCRHSDWKSFADCIWDAGHSQQLRARRRCWCVRRLEA